MRSVSSCVLTMLASFQSVEIPMKKMNVLILMIRICIDIWPMSVRRSYLLRPLQMNSNLLSSVGHFRESNDR